MTTSLVRTRHGTTDDIDPVTWLLERCSPQTLERRFHVPVSAVPPAVVRRLVLPPSGWSLLAEQGEELIGHGCAAPVSRSRVEIGLLVDDAFAGTGSVPDWCATWRLEATVRGFCSMTCTVDPDNAAVLPTVRKAGFEGSSSYRDGVVEIDIPLRMTATHEGDVTQTA